MEQAGTGVGLEAKVEVEVEVGLSAEMMLRHLGWIEAANLVIKGMEGAIEAKTVTYDFERLMENATLVTCSGFSQAIIKHM